MLEKPRIGSIGDALRCSEILNNWIEKTIWMPRLYSKQELLEIIEGAIPMREICIAVIAVIWRRERDSNPRRPCSLNGFQVRRFQPLTHPSWMIIL